MTLVTDRIETNHGGGEDPFLTGVSDLLVLPESRGGMIYTATHAGNAGLAAWSMDATGRAIRQDTADLPAPEVAGLQTRITDVALAGGDVMIAWNAGDTPPMRISKDGEFGTDVSKTALPADTKAVEVVHIGDVPHLYTTRAGSKTVDHWTMDDGGALSLVGTGAHPMRIGDMGLTDLTHVSVGGLSWLIAAGDGADTAASYRIGDDGALTPGMRIAIEDGPGISMPLRVESAVVGGKAYVLIGGAGSSSLSVFEMSASGSFAPVDHVIDGRATRFQQIDTLSIHEIDGEIYVLAAGADDGVTILQLLPGGRLLHLTTLEDTLDSGLTNVGNAVLTSRDGDLVVAVVSNVEPGLSWIEIDRGRAGQTLMTEGGASNRSGTDGDDVLVGGTGRDTLSGGNGADILMDGDGSDILTGGSGADIFVLDNDGAADRITDFEVGVDTLDLSAWMFLRNDMQLDIKELPDGAEIRFGTEILRIDSAKGQSLSRSDVLKGGVVDLDRLLPAWFDEDPVIQPVAVDPAPNPPVWGSAGADRIDGSGSNDQISGRSGADTLNGGSGDDTLAGGNDDDILNGGPGSDRMDGGAGDDRLDGGSGRDTMIGGPGSDTFVVDRVSDRIEERAEWRGIDTILAAADYSMVGTHVENLIMSSKHGNLRARGNDLDNTIWGNGHDNMFDSWGGRTTILGGKGNDIYYMRSDRAIAVEDPGEGLDIVRAFSSYRLPDHVERLELQTVRDGAGRKIDGLKAIGNDQNNDLVGNDQANMLIGREGRDTLTGRGGADTFVFDRAAAPGNVDTVTDFEAGLDEIWIKADLMGADTGDLDIRICELGTSARWASTRLLYDTKTGDVRIDPDGRGGMDAELLFTFTGGDTPRVSDVLLF